jgi:hypothetical protein
MVQKLQALRCNMSLNLHFLHSLLDYFSEKVRGTKRRTGRKIPSDIKAMERKQQSQWDVSMMADYCWYLTRDNP